MNPTTLSGLREVCEYLRGINKDFSLVWLEILCVVQNNPGITQVEMGSKIKGITLPALSKGSANILMREHGFLRQEEGDNDRRLKKTYLTAKGERLLAEITAMMFNKGR
jgi:DNA-binding MarR family transcriptional regulator